MTEASTDVVALVVISPEPAVLQVVDYRLMPHETRQVMGVILPHQCVNPDQLLSVCKRKSRCTITGNNSISALDGAFGSWARPHFFG